MIRVLFAIGGMYGGGSERQTLEILRHLDRERFAPELYLVSGQGELFDQIPADVPVHIYERRRSSRRWLLPGAAMRDRVRDLAAVLDQRRIDLVCDRTYHMTLLTAAAVRRRRTPRISIIVSDPRRDFETNVERFRAIKRWLLWRAYRDADVVAAVSDGVRQAASEYHRIPLERIEVFNNVYDVGRIRQRAAEPLPSPWQRRPGEERIVAAGRLHVAKGYDVLIDAVRELVHNRGRSSVRLLIAGSGPLESDLRECIARHGLERHVELVGFLENPLPLVRSADVYCLSSRYEGLPNALVEAILCGVPAVATDCRSGPREILEDGRWGELVPAEEAPALAAAILRTLDGLQASMDRAHSAAWAAEQRFSLATGMTRFDELVGRALHSQ